MFSRIIADFALTCNRQANTPNMRNSLGPTMGYD